MFSTLAELAMLTWGSAPLAIDRDRWRNAKHVRRGRRRLWQHHSNNHDCLSGCFHLGWRHGATNRSARCGNYCILSTTGALPTGFTAGTQYFVVNPSGATFELAATLGGSAINSSGSQSGTQMAGFGAGSGPGVLTVNKSTFPFGGAVGAWNAVPGMTVNLLGPSGTVHRGIQQSGQRQRRGHGHIRRRHLLLYRAPLSILRRSRRGPTARYIYSIIRGRYSRIAREAMSSARPRKRTGKGSIIGNIENIQLAA